MILGTYQPIGLDDEGHVKSQLAPISYKHQMYDDFNTMYFRYTNIDGAKLRMELEHRHENAGVDVSAWGSLVMGGSIHSAILAVRGYKNVLVIPSWNDEAVRFNKLTQTRDNAFLPYAGSGIHFFPIINWYNECDARLTVATVRSANSFFDYLYKQYAGIEHLPGKLNRLIIARSDEYYKLGDENYFRHLKGTTEEKYDAVVLMDVPNGQDGRFNSHVLKRDFAHLCTDDFDLLEFNTHTVLDDPHRLYNKKDINDDVDRALGIITPVELKKEIIEMHGGEEMRFRTPVQQSFRVQANHLKKKIRCY